MKTIWKYRISLETFQDIKMPEGSTLLTLHKQGSRQEDEVYLWCLVDTEKPLETRRFLLATTGSEFPLEKVEYVGTLWFLNGTYVVHLLEILKG